jgi:glycosidase
LNYFKLFPFLLLFTSTGTVWSRSLPYTFERNSSSAQNNSTEWIKDAVIYKVYLRSFSKEGKLRELEARLPEIQKLGANCIELLPFHPTIFTSSNTLSSPYDVSDYWSVDLEYGTKDGFNRLVQEAHVNGLKIILGWSPNINALNQGLQKNTTSTVPMDFDSLEMQNFVTDLLTYWVREFDVDGFNIQPASGLPTSVIQKISLELKRIKPSLVIAGQQIHPDQQSFFDVVASTSLYSTIWQVVQDQGAVETIYQILREETPSQTNQPLVLRWIENQDTPRAESKWGSAHQPAAVLLFTSGGVPMLYNGQEIGETHQPSLTLREPIHWTAGLKKNADLKKFYKQILQVRAEHPAFSKGQTFPLKISPSPSSSPVLAFARSYRGDAALVAINFSSQTFQGTLEVPEIFRSEDGKLKVKNVFPGEPLQTVNNASEAVMKLPPWGYQIWVMRRITF